MTQEQLLQASLLHDELERLTRMLSGIKDAFPENDITVASLTHSSDKPEIYGSFVVTKEDSKELRWLLVAWAEKKIELLNKEIQQL